MPHVPDNVEEVLAGNVLFVQPEWIGTISALAGAGVAGAMAIVRDALAERRQAVRDENQRRHEIEEARFGSRRDAYVSFAAACQKAITSTDDFESQHGLSPGDMGYDGPLRGVVDALDLVLIIGPEEVSLAATNASRRLHEWAFGGGSRSPATEAVDEFQAVSRRILKFD